MVQWEGLTEICFKRFPDVWCTVQITSFSFSSSISSLAAIQSLVSRKALLWPSSVRLWMKTPTRLTATRMTMFADTWWSEVVTVTGEAHLLPLADQAVLLSGRVHHADTDHCVQTGQQETHCGGHPRPTAGGGAGGGEVTTLEVTWSI